MHVMEKYPTSDIAESYRTLRMNLQYSYFGSNHKVIVVTSANPKEGKSTVAANIALALSQDDKKVILIDCDLRKPTLDKRFNIPNETGLTELVMAKEKEITFGYKYNENLTILTSGKIPLNPTEILSSNYMLRLTNTLRNIFDYVILDTPSIEVVTDAQILAAKFDGTILVVKAETTKKSSVHNAINILRRVNANIIGVVLNEIEIRKSDDFYGE